MARSSLRPVDANFSTAADTGRFVLRVALGVLILLHGISKLPGPPEFLTDPVLIVAQAELLAAIDELDAQGKAGLPPMLAWLVYVGEILAPVLLILGLWTRAAAVVIAGNMIVALALVHVPQLLHMNKEGGYALELQAMYLFTAVAVALLGAGRYSIGGRYGPMN